MNIKELKELIKELPDEMLVVTDGYESGYKLVERTEVIRVHDYKNNSTLYGEFVREGSSKFKVQSKRGNTTFVSDAFYLSRNYGFIFEFKETKQNQKTMDKESLKVDIKFYEKELETYTSVIAKVSDDDECSQGIKEKIPYFESRRYNAEQMLIILRNRLNKLQNKKS